MKEKPDHARQVFTARPVLAGQRNHPGQLPDLSLVLKETSSQFICQPGLVSSAVQPSDKAVVSSSIPRYRF